MKATERWPIGLGVAGLLLLAAPIVLLFRAPEAAPPAAPGGKQRQVTQGPGLDLYPSLSPDGGSVVYASARSAGFELYITGADGRERQLTTDGQHNVQPAWSPDGATIAYHSRTRGGIWLIAAAGGEPVRASAFGSRPSWSPDGASIAFQSESQIDASWTSVVPLAPSVIHVVGAKGGEPRAVTRTGGPAGGHGNPAWTPQGDRIVFVAYDRVRAALWLVAPDGSGLEPLPVPADQPMVSDPASCAGCDSIFYVSYSEQGSYGIWRLRLGASAGPEWVRAQVIGHGLERVRHLSLSRDGRRLAYSAVSAVAQIASVDLDPATSAQRSAPRLVTSGTGRSSRPLFSPDGRYLAFSRVQPGGRSDVWIADADGQNPFLLTDNPATDGFPSWFPDSSRVAFLSDRGGQAGLWVADLKTRTATLLRELSEPFDAPRLSADGTHVAFNWARDGALTTWVMPVAGGEPRQLTTGPELLTFPAWSPDGRTLALQTKRGGDTQVAVLGLSPGSPPRRAGEPRLLTTEPGLNWPHSWSPDGDKVAFAAFRDETSWNIRWVSRSTGEQREITSYRTPAIYVRYPAWSPQGDRIAFEYAETRADIWTIDGP